LDAVIQNADINGKHAGVLKPKIKHGCKDASMITWNQKKDKEIMTTEIAIVYADEDTAFSYLQKKFGRCLGTIHITYPGRKSQKIGYFFTKSNGLGMQQQTMVFQYLDGLGGV